MADTESTGAAPVVLLNNPSPVARAMSRIKAGQADTFAAIEKGELGPTPPSPKVTKVVEVLENDTPDPEAPEPETAPDDAEVEADAVKVDAEPGGDKVDAETSKRIAAVQKAEQRSREKVASE